MTNDFHERKKDYEREQDDNFYLLLLFLSVPFHSQKNKLIFIPNSSMEL